MNKVVAMILLLASGCATSEVRFGREESVVYPATYADCSLVETAIDEQATLLLFVLSPLLALDFGCSIISDTVLLPYDLVRWPFESISQRKEQHE